MGNLKKKVNPVLLKMIQGLGKPNKEKLVIEYSDLDIELSESEIDIYYRKVNGDNYEENR